MKKCSDCGEPIFSTIGGRKRCVKCANTSRREGRRTYHKDYAAKRRAKKMECKTTVDICTSCEAMPREPGFKNLCRLCWEHNGKFWLTHNVADIVTGHNLYLYDLDSDLENAMGHHGGSIECSQHDRISRIMEDNYADAIRLG